MHSRKTESGTRAVSRALLVLLLALLAGLTGCGGGGGGGTPGGPTGNVTVIGRVLVAETGNPPASPGATISINGHTTTTNATDGTFTLSSVAVSATTATVTAAGEQTRTLALKLPSGTTLYDLGDIYISSGGYTASASGTVVTPVGGKEQPLAGAAVTIAGSTVLTGTDGSFSITGLPVGLGPDPTTQIGVVRAKTYVDKPIMTQFPFLTGNNPLGQIVIQSPVGALPPTFPYTVTGRVQHGTTGLPGISVAIFAGNTQLGNPVQTDANGNYFFWVVPGTYSVVGVESGGQQSTVQVTLNAPNVPVTAPPINF